MRRNKRSQSHVEFILATFLFLILIIFLFTALFVRTQPEAIKIGDQTACQNAEAIADILTDDEGVPTDWDADPYGPTTLGLSNGTQGIITYEKWQRMENLGYSRIVNTCPPNASWYAKYRIYAFPSTDDGTCPGIADAAQICRGSTGVNQLYIAAISDNPSTTFGLRIFFPEAKGVSIAANSFEAEDNVTIDETQDNGTTIEAYFLTSPSDTDDTVTLQFPSPLPDMNYVKFVEFKSLGGELPVYLGNITMQDYFGAGVPGNGTSGPSGVIPPKNYCTVEKRANLRSSQNPTAGELLPIDFEVVAW